MPKRLLQTRNTLTINKDRISRKNVRDKEHIIISGVTHMIGDAVMNGIHYPISKTKILSDSLSNKRVVMPSSHPIGDNGEFISASDPLALMSNFIGAFAFNFSIQDDRLISDVAIDPVIANRTASGKQIIDAINAGDPIDVSTGFYLNVEDAEGFGSDGEPFTGIASKLFLDHVAFLPNEAGAKNKLEGVGLHTNSAIDVDGNELDTDIAELFNNASSPAMSLPLAPNNFAWNESAALNRIKKFTNSESKPSTNFRKFFLNFDQSNVDSFDSYTNLFADIINGVPHAVKSPIESATNNDNAEKYNKRFAGNNSFKQALSNKLDKLFAWMQNSGYTNDNLTTNDNDGDRVMREKLIKALNKAGVKTEGLDDDAIFAAYNKMDKKDDKGGKDDNEGLTEEEIIKKKAKDKFKDKIKPNNLTGDELTTVINIAVKEAVDAGIKPLQEQLSVNADKELNDLAKQVGELKKGISEEVAKGMGVNACNDFLAANGVAVFNTNGGQHNNKNHVEGVFEMDMPGGEK